MALWLHRNQYFNEFVKDTVNGEIIAPGEYYYIDDETGDTISCRKYWELKKEYLEDNNPYDKLLNYAENQYDYAKSLEQKEQEYLQGSILNKTIADRDYQ